MKLKLVMSALVGGMVFGVLAHADTIQIDTLGRDTRYVGSELRVDEATGAGKVLLKLEERISGPRVCHPRPGIVVGPNPWYPGHGPGPGYGHPPLVDCGPEFRLLERTVAVPGLSYDVPSAHILFADREGRKTVCARVSQQYAKITHHPYLAITPTGSCRAFASANGAGVAVLFEAN